MKRAQPFLIAIAGGSGAGKTWLGQHIARAFPGQVAQISLDDFYRDRSPLAPAARSRVNYDHPRAMDWPLLWRFLQDYRSGSQPVMPRYDFATHCRQQRSAITELKPVLLVEGLWTFARPELRCLFDERIYVECPQRVCLQRRIARDTTERGRSTHEVRAQFHRCVSPMHNIHVLPQKRWATIQLSHPISEAHLMELIARLRARLQRGKQSEKMILLPQIPGPVEQRVWRHVA